MNIGKYIELYSEDLRIKNYSNNTIQNYVSQVRCFLEYYNNVATKPPKFIRMYLQQYYRTYHYQFKILKSNKYVKSIQCTN